MNNYSQHSKSTSSAHELKNSGRFARALSDVAIQDTKSYDYFSKSTQFKSLKSYDELVVVSKSITISTPTSVLFQGRSVLRTDNRKIEETETYRYGFNGQEKDDEVSGSGNSYTAEFWQYDSRLGRRWNIDPVVKEHESPYATFANNPIWFADPNGADTVNFKNAMKHSGSGLAAQECLDNSPQFLRFFNEFTTDDGKYKDILLEFKAENLTTHNSSEAGRVYLAYKGKELTEKELNAYKNSDFNQISKDAKLSDFKIVCIINTRREKTHQETIAYKTVTLIHEMTVHVYNHAEILVANRNTSSPTVFNGRAVCSATLQRVSASEYGQDHDELFSGKNLLYNQCRTEIQNASDKIYRPILRQYKDEFGRDRSEKIKYGVYMRSLFEDDCAEPRKFEILKGGK